MNKLFKTIMFFGTSASCFHIGYCFSQYEEKSRRLRCENTPRRGPGRRSRTKLEDKIPIEGLCDAIFSSRGK